MVTPNPQKMHGCVRLLLSYSDVCIAHAFAIPSTKTLLFISHVKLCGRILSTKNIEFFALERRTIMTKTPWMIIYNPVIYSTCWINPYDLPHCTLHKPLEGFSAWPLVLQKPSATGLMTTYVSLSFLAACHWCNLHSKASGGSAYVQKRWFFLSACPSRSGLHIAGPRLRRRQRRSTSSRWRLVAWMIFPFLTLWRWKKHLSLSMPCRSHPHSQQFSSQLKEKNQLYSNTLGVDYSWSKTWLTFCSLPQNPSRRVD